MIEPPNHDAHVVTATKIFRDCGFTLGAMQHPKPPEAIEALRRFNGVPSGVPHPVAWDYFPNQYFRDNWQRYYGTPLKVKQQDGSEVTLFVRDTTSNRLFAEYLEKHDR